MPSIDALAPSRFLRKAHLERPRLATIKGIQAENVAPQNRAPDIKPVVYFEEFSEGVPVGKEQREQLKLIMATDDVSAMVGRQVVIMIDPNIVYGGQRVGGIRFRAPKPRPPQGIPAVAAAAAAPPQGWKSALPTDIVAPSRQDDPPWVTDDSQTDYGNPEPDQVDDDIPW